ALDTDDDMPDINNGVEVGQSTIFEANSDLQKFQMLALGGDDTADYSMYSGSMNSRAEILPRITSIRLNWRIRNSCH
ncbi:hypothetical protein MKX03_020406, partial [Papaver bracteatum]